jgi:hypothetical protein
MLIQCTKLLLDKLGVKSEVGLPEMAICSWHANLLTIQRRNAVILINDASRYCILLYGLKGPDFKNLDAIITAAMEETFLAEGISQELVTKYSATGPVRYAKTSDKGVMAVMNQIARIATGYEAEDLTFTSINQLEFNLRRSGWIFTLNGSYADTKKTLLEGMARF